MIGCFHCTGYMYNECVNDGVEIWLQ